MAYKFWNGFKAGVPANIRVEDYEDFDQMLNEQLFIDGRGQDLLLAELLQPIFDAYPGRVVLSNIPRGSAAFQREGTVDSIIDFLRRFYFPAGYEKSMPYTIGVYNVARTGDDRILFCAVTHYKKDLTFARKKRSE